MGVFNLQPNEHFWYAGLNEKGDVEIFEYIVLRSKNLTGGYARHWFASVPDGVEMNMSCVSLEQDGSLWRTRDEAIKQLASRLYEKREEALAQAGRLNAQILKVTELLDS